MLLLNLINCQNWDNMAYTETENNITHCVLQVKQRRVKEKEKKRKEPMETMLELA